MRARFASAPSPMNITSPSGSVPTNSSSGAATSSPMRLNSAPPLNAAAYTCDRRASNMGASVPLKPHAPYASASSASTPMQRAPTECANALTVVTPMRTPVNEPGPTAHANRFTSLG